MSIDGNDQPAPLSVPDLEAGSAPHGGSPTATTVPGVSSGVSDEDRNRYGVLLDHAAERGLLSPAEYQVRLGELAEAASVDELQRIVTELPSFGAPGAAAEAPHRVQRSTGTSATRAAPDPVALDAALWSNLTPATARRGSGNPWLILVVLLVVLVVAMVVLALVAAHLTHAHPTAAPLTVAAVLSRLRL